MLYSNTQNRDYSLPLERKANKVKELNNIKSASGLACCTCANNKSAITTDTAVKITVEDKTGCEVCQALQSFAFYGLTAMPTTFELDTLFEEMDKQQTVSSKKRNWGKKLWVKWNLYGNQQPRKNIMGQRLIKESQFSATPSRVFIIPAQNYPKIFRAIVISAWA